MKAEDWAEIVRGVAEKRGLTYEPVGGLNPRGGPAALNPGGTNRITGELSDGYWGSSCDADEREEGGLFKKTVLPTAVLAKAHMPDLARVVPMFNVDARVPRLGGADRPRDRLRDHREAALFPLAPRRSQRRRLRARARHRRRPVHAPAQRDGGVRHQHVPRRALARGPGAVPEHPGPLRLVFPVKVRGNMRLDGIAPG
jgi:hypothetical protein